MSDRVNDVLKSRPISLHIDATGGLTLFEFGITVEVDEDGQKEVEKTFTVDNPVLEELITTLQVGREKIDAF